MLMKKKKQWKQIAACALAATLTVSAFPASVMAASEQTNAQQQAEVIEQWDFDDAQTGLDGWENGGSYAYDGEVSIAYDSETVGSGALKLSVAYDSEISWSEVKVQNSNAKLAGATSLSCDFYYNPAAMTTGSFNMKAFANEAFDVYKAVTMEGESLENGYCKGSITLQFDPTTQEVGTLLLGVIGSMTDYTGDILLDNITLYAEEVEDIYVDVTEQVGQASKTEGLTYSDTVSLVDENADVSTAGLMAYLQAVGKTDYVLYGHQNDTHHKGGSSYEGSTNSDTKDITGSIAAICGIDTLSFTGAELSLPDGQTDSVDEAAAISIEAAQQGGIITLSAHMPNFAQVAEKPRTANGGYDYSGYSPGVTTGDVMSRILPGGDLNEVYNGYLDLIAKYAHILAEQNIPVLFRPLHENNGSWFWWGAAFCDEEGYKNVYRYTVQYLRDVKDVHNFLYIYSPNGPFDSIEQYESRYPGDEYIDIIAFDMYHDNPTETDGWMNSFQETVELVQSVAQKHGKLATVSETGMRVQTSLGDGNNYGGIAPSGNKRLEWFSEVNQIVSESDMPYYMVWANFDAKSNFFAPYMVSATRGHEMVNEFIKFYNEESSVFADGVTFYEAMPDVTVNSQQTSGYIMAPTSNSRVLEATTLLANVKHADPSKKVEFVLYNKEKTKKITIEAAPYAGEDAVLNAIETVYTAELTAQQLEEIGATIGTMDLVYDGTILNTIAAMYNIAEQEKDPTIVDDFESYFGEQALLLNEWATNTGMGCSLDPALSTEYKNSGQYGLEFKYHISTEKVNEGWAGMTRSMEADWSEFNALQLWIRPDGNGQKLVIQLTSNGEDFEVFLNEFAATTEAKLVTIPFSALKGKSGGTFDPANITRAGIWCNTIPAEGTTGAWTVDSVMYFDDMKAVQTDVTEITYEDTTPVQKPLSISYRTHVQNDGWQDFVADGMMSGTKGKSLRLEGIEIRLDNNAIGGGVEYRTHVQNDGWQDYVADGAMSGTTGRNLRLEAIQIRLTGAIAEKYDIYYRTHIQDKGWLGWAVNDGKSGSAGLSKRLEAIEIRLVEKGGEAPGSTENAYLTNKKPANPTISYRTHVQNEGWQDYVAGGVTSGTTGKNLRLEAIEIQVNGDGLNGNVEYRTHVQNDGWQDYVANGAMAGTKGRSLRLEAIQIRLTGELAQKYHVEYRTHVQNEGWQNWVRDDAMSGTTGKNLRLEAIEIRLVKR